MIGGSERLLQWRSVVSSVPQSRCSSVPGLLETGCWEQITFEGWFSLRLIFSKEAVKSAFKGIRIKWDHCWHVQNKNGLSCWVVFDRSERILECINENIVNIGTMRWFCLYVEYSLKSAFIIQSLFLKYPWKYIDIYIYNMYFKSSIFACLWRFGRFLFDLALSSQMTIEWPRIQSESSTPSLPFTSFMTSSKLFYLSNASVSSSIKWGYSDFVKPSNLTYLIACCED